MGYTQWALGRLECSTHQWQEGFVSETAQVASWHCQEGPAFLEVSSAQGVADSLSALASYQLPGGLGRSERGFSSFW